MSSSHSFLALLALVAAAAPLHAQAQTPPPPQPRPQITFAPSGRASTEINVSSESLNL
jgi:hypothetical protein